MENERLKKLVDEYRQEVESCGRPVELVKQIDDLSNQLSSTQYKLEESMENAHQLEITYVPQPPPLRPPPSPYPHQWPEIR